MKKLCLSFTLVLMLAVVGSTAFSAYPIVIKVSKSKKEDRDVKNFTGVAAGGPLTIIVTLGNTEGLRFEGDTEAISTLITEVKGNTLIIRPENSWTSWERKYKGKKIVAYVSAKSIKTLVMSGNGSLTVKGNIKGSALSATLSGSGHIDANVDVDNLTGVISGSGNLNIAGTADHASITISGSGNLAKKGLSVGSLQTVISGSGSVNINANNSINAVISGSGNVNYSGNASVEKRVFGSGGVRKI
ncbi:MAG: head GIN domain-containing protein [Pedobacter sp.]|nr:head GIN domain-containing protein [Pedobacter sp.]MDQ8054386.1 head GIN domain-containing protein [Pedobacter sp.]